MLNIEITETKNFVKKLLMEPVFDTFLLVEAYVRSDVSYTIDGRLNPSFFIRHGGLSDIISSMSSRAINSH